MKEFEVTIKVRNNRLKQRREELGMTQGELARAADVSLDYYRRLEGMVLSPTRLPPEQRSQQERGEWRPAVLRLAEFHCVSPEELFPPAVHAIQKVESTCKVDGSDIHNLLSEYQERAALPPGIALDEQERREIVDKALALLPPREADVIRKRFGFGAIEPMTLSEIGQDRNVGRNRIMQIEAKAFRRLRDSGPIRRMLKPLREDQ